MVLVSHVVLQDHQLKRHMTLWVEAAQGKSASSQV